MPGTPLENHIQSGCSFDKQIQRSNIVNKKQNPHPLRFDYVDNKSNIVTNIKRTPLINLDLGISRPDLQKTLNVSQASNTYDYNLNLKNNNDISIVCMDKLSYRKPLNKTSYYFDTEISSNISKSYQAQGHVIPIRNYVDMNKIKSRNDEMYKTNEA